MRETVTTTTLTCDKCRKVVGQLNELQAKDQREPSYRASSGYALYCELCDECWFKYIADVLPDRSPGARRAQKMPWPT